MGKFIMHKGRSEQSPSFAARNQKTEAGRKRRPHAMATAQCHRDGRGVRDATKFVSELSRNRLQNRGSGVGWSGDNKGIEKLRSASARRRNQPAVFFEFQLLHWRDRKSTRLNSSHQIISYAVFCLKK